MKPIIFITVLLAIASSQAICAEESARVGQMEAELDTLQQASLEQSERLRSLKSKVSAQESALSKNMPTSPAAESMSDDGRVEGKSSREKDGSEQKYID